jgi:predicted alternative tryptophan synthase beta-subunit
MDSVKYILSEKDMPTRWYNIQADLPEPLPPYMHPATKQPLGPTDSLVVSYGTYKTGNVPGTIRRYS